MGRKGWVFALVIILAVAFVVPPLTQRADGGERDAVQVAQRWLKVVDGGRYETSWDEAATLFQRAVAKDQWVQQIGAVRDPLGKATTRKLLGAKRMKQLPGAPDGEYVVIQFSTSFENKKSAVETITPMKDGARGWRVSGYYIK